MLSFDKSPMITKQNYFSSFTLPVSSIISIKFLGPISNERKTNLEMDMRVVEPQTGFY